MRIGLFAFLNAVAVLSLLSGCERKIDPEPWDSSIYPIQDGKYRTYRVSDTTFILSGGVNAVGRTYLRRELANGTETDLLGREVSVLEIHTAQFDDEGNPLSWEPNAIWQQWKDNRFAERVEGNTRYQVLAFPVTRNRQWDGNEFNGNNNIPTLGYSNFTYLRTDTTVVVAGRAYPNCVVVQQRRIDNSLISNIYTYEVYAPGIGKIERYDRYLYYILRDQNIELSTESYVYHEVLTDHNYVQ